MALFSVFKGTQLIPMVTSMMWSSIVGLAILTYFLWGWFRDQINESMSGLFSKQLGISYRQGMMWFIGSEVMFFAGFFGALYYTRAIVMPWLGGASNNASVQLTITNADIGLAVGGFYTGVLTIIVAPE